MKDEKIYKEFLQENNLKDVEIGRAFGYKSRQSWHSAFRRKKVIAGILFLIDKIKKASALLVI